MFQTIHLKKLLFSLFVTLGTGALAGLLTQQKPLYESLTRPPLSPPGWVFGVVWTVLYALMGIALYRILRTPKSGERGLALRLFAMQLTANFIWPLLFFGLRLYVASAVLLGILIVLILLTMRSFYRLDRVAFYLMVPYLIWCLFALYLNIGVAVLQL